MYRFYKLKSADDLRETMGWMKAEPPLKVGTILKLKVGPYGRWIVMEVGEVVLDREPTWRKWEVGGL